VDVRTRIPVTREQVSLKEVIQVLWARRWRAAGFTTALVVLVAIISLIVPKKYEATITVAAVSQTPGSQMGGLSSMMSQFGGLASLAGLSLNVNSHKEETVAVLQSRDLTEQYIQQNNLLPVLYPRLWDARLKRWKTTDPEKIPSLWKANEYFKHSIRSVTESTKTGLVTLTITWTNPQQAAQWANGLVDATNDYLRSQASAEADRNVAYLEQEAARTEEVGVKQAIYMVLESEIDKAALARSTQQYALKILDHAAPPAKASSPQKKVWCLLALLTALFLCVFAAFVEVAWRDA